MFAWAGKDGVTLGFFYFLHLKSWLHQCNVIGIALLCIYEKMFRDFFETNEDPNNYPENNTATIIRSLSSVQRMVCSSENGSFFGQFIFYLGLLCARIFAHSGCAQNYSRKLTHILMIAHAPPTPPQQHTHKNTYTHTHTHTYKYTHTTLHSHSLSHICPLNLSHSLSHLSIQLSIHASMHPCIHPCIHASMHPFIHTYTPSSIYPSIYLSIH